MPNSPAPAIGATDVPDAFRLAAPIFVVGLNKSGTSLLYLLLSQHEDLSGLKPEKTREKEKTGTAMLYLANHGLTEGHKIPGMIEKLRPADNVSRYACPEVIGRYRLTERDVEPGDRATVSRAFRDAMANPGVRLCEKSPPNLIRTRYLQALFPDATFVAIVRDPYANVSAIGKKRSKWGTLEDMAVHWSTAYSHFLKDRQHLQRCLLVRYEDLAEDPGAVLSEICAFCGLQLTPAMLAAMAVEANLNEELVDQLDGDDLALITRVCGPTMAALGYSARSRSDGRLPATRS